MDMPKFVTKKFVLIALASVLVLTGLVWLIVANMQPKFKSGIATVPAAYTVSGNGTASVMVDNYLYFVGGKAKTEDLQYGDNDYYKKGVMPEAGIYRVRLEDGQPVVNYTYDNHYYDEDGAEKEYVEGEEKYNQQIVGISDWEHLGEKGCLIERVVPKIAGHENTAMWVFGNTLIYVTPNNLMNKVGELRSGYLDFYRVDLNGKHHKLIYTTAEKDLTTADFTVWANGANNIYLLINESGTLKQVSVAKGKVTEIATDVVDVVFPQVAAYRRGSDSEDLAQVYGGVMSYVYYTKKHAEEDVVQNGNVMYRYQIAGGQDAEKIAEEGTANGGTTFKPLLAAAGQFVFSSYKTEGTVDEAHAVKRYSVLTNDMQLDTTKIEAEFERLPRVTLGTDSEITFYPYGFWQQGGSLRRYTVTNDKIDVSDKTIYTKDISGFLAYYDQKIYVKASTGVQVIDVSRAPLILGTADFTAYEDNYPVGILLPTYASGDGLTGVVIYTYDNGEIILHRQYGNQTAYLKMSAPETENDADADTDDTNAMMDYDA